MGELELNVISAEKTLFKGKVRIVQLPGTEGKFSILHNHAPLIAALQKGEIVYQLEGDSEEKRIEISSGFVEVNKNKVTVCAE